MEAIHKAKRPCGLFKRKMRDGTKSETWHYDFVIRGRRHKGSTGLRDKGKAREFLDELKAEKRLGRKLDATQRPTLPTFEEYAKAYRRGEGAMKKSGADDQSILDRALVPFFGSKHLDEITRADVVRFRNERLGGKLYMEGRNRKTKVTPGTVQRELALLKTILSTAVESDPPLLAANPVPKLGKTLKLRTGKRERVIDRDEYGRLLLAVAPRSVNKAGIHEGGHLRPMMVLAFETGMREGEIRGLRWADVDFRTHFARLADTKNGDSRSVPLSEAAEKALREWGRGNNTYVFPSLTGEGIIGNTATAFRRLARRAKVQDVRFHDFRHTFCTRKLVDEGESRDTIKAITGHRTDAMLARYTHPSEASKLAAVRGAEVTPFSHPARSTA